MNKKILLSAILLLLVFSTGRVFADHLSAKYLFSARLNGGNEVPAVSTSALGLATFNLNDTRDTLCIEMTATGLSGSITGAHIHEGAASTNGPVIVNLTPHITGNRIKATITGSTLSASFIEKMFMGMYYLNVHTNMNMNGEIRGQILPEEDKGMAVLLNGTNEVPSVSTGAHAVGFFMLQKHQGKLSFKIVADGLSGPITGAHLHKNVAGQNGPVIESLTNFINGNMISGSVDPSAYKEALMSDSLYINIHTAANPNGEIRGQLVMQPYLHFDAMMDTAQETTMVTGTGNEMGVAALRLNYTFDTLWYNIQVNGLTGAITGAHFHKGGVNTSGPVILGLPPGNINGNMISGIVTGTDLSDSFMHFMLEGGLYLNVHTSANPSGEVRGQVYRTFREGYTYHINGAQEVPMVSSKASGTGMVSIDRDQTSAHYMMVIDSLTGYSAAHFHNNVAGENGPVMYNLSSMYMNGGIFGYWLDTDPNTPFTAAMSNKFRKDSVYVNVHTSANANGEVRGNVDRVLCNAIPQSVNSLGGISVDTKLYPNPAHNTATLDIQSSAATNAQITLTDMMGRIVWTQEKQLRYGFNRVYIPIEQLNTGIYSVLLRNNDGQVLLKLLKD